MTVDYDKLVNLDYTAYDHSMDFREGLERNGIRNPEISVEKSYEDGVPTVDVEATDSFLGTSYSESYRLEGVTEEEFEEVMYDVWDSAFQELEI
ncbi:hypothetical protein AQV86_03780 [Nanohaloarchaea archaeon SG9]|nr:hypothetical protein AQV86_03780 [Nanohaloarchaea archaeon SG9]